MAVVSRNPEDMSKPSFSAADDPLLPWLRSIHKSTARSRFSQLNNSTDLDLLVSNCINTFKSDPRYRDDVRYLKIWFLYMDGSSDYERVFREMEERRICIHKALLYESFALFLEAKGRLIDACMIITLASQGLVVANGSSKKRKEFLKLKKQGSKAWNTVVEGAECIMVQRCFRATEQISMEL
ncbi:UNVERIFIED_CONTAM: Mitotic checkpoint serine/threonine-protein kinase BUB1 [Sesamum calycinum]|uniref:Mitotic checkpoint serine/threonine-protein kinase BUB1 n=1 Tax=Sesamum calycinum TaxID=2727403 RepID=A0AAW2Q3G9_9LAMI